MLEGNKYGSDQGPGVLPELKNLPGQKFFLTNLVDKLCGTDSVGDIDSPKGHPQPGGGHAWRRPTSLASTKEIRSVGPDGKVSYRYVVGDDLTIDAGGKQLTGRDLRKAVEEAEKGWAGK